MADMLNDFSHFKIAVALQPTRKYMISIFWIVKFYITKVIADCLWRMQAPGFQG